MSKIVEWEVALKATFHSTISMRGQRATGKIQKNSYHHESCGPSLTTKTMSMFLIFTQGTLWNVKNRWVRSSLYTFYGKIGSSVINGFILYVFSVHRRVFSTSGVTMGTSGGYMSTSGDIMSTSGGYHEHIGGISWAHRGDIMNTSGDVQYIEGFQYIGVFNRNWKDFIKLLPHMHHDIPSIYWTSPDVLMISPDVLMVSPTFIMISPRCTHDIPPMYWTPPDVLNTHTGWGSKILAFGLLYTKIWVEVRRFRKYKNKSCKCSRFQLTWSQTVNVLLGHPVGPLGKTSLFCLPWDCWNFRIFWAFYVYWSCPSQNLSATLWILPLLQILKKLWTFITG